MSTRVNPGIAEVNTSIPTIPTSGHVLSWTSALETPLAWWMAVTLMFGALLIPVLAAGIPPLTDYPNHLARCYVLAFGQSDPFLREMFSAHWQIIPNIGVDLTLPALMHVFSPLTAGRIMIGLCLFLPTSGAMALNYAYFRRRSFWQLAAGFAAFNALFLMGFMNFELSIGIALWGAAGWAMYRERFPAVTVALAVLVGTLAFFFHLFGACFFALLIGSEELAKIHRHGWRSSLLRPYAAKRVLLLFTALSVPSALYVMSPLERIRSDAAWPHLAQKASNLFVSFMDYSSMFDVLVVAGVLGFLIATLLARRVRLSKSAALCCAILLLAYAVMPRALKGGYFVDTRLPVMLGFMLFAGCLPRKPKSREWAVAGIVLAALFLARIGFITSVWVHSQQDISELRQVIAGIAPGSRVLAADVLPSDNPRWFEKMPISRRLPELTPTYWHLASFVLLDRHAFWPMIFAASSQQPIRVKEPYSDLLAHESPPPNYAELTAKQIAPQELERFPFLADWDHKFDYVLVLNAEGAPNLENFDPAHLQLVARRGIAALFKVTG